MTGHVAISARQVPLLPAPGNFHGTYLAVLGLGSRTFCREHEMLIVCQPLPILGRRSDLRGKATRFRTAKPSA